MSRHAPNMRIPRCVQHSEWMTNSQRSKSWLRLITHSLTLQSGNTESSGCVWIQFCSGTGKYNYTYTYFLFSTSYRWKNRNLNIEWETESLIAAQWLSEKLIQSNLFKWHTDYWITGHPRPRQIASSDHELVCSIWFILRSYVYITW